MSDVVKNYEAAFAAWLGRSDAFAFWKGRVASYAIMKAMGIGQGDEVIMPGYTCVANVNPIKYLGARPVYIDIEPETFNLDVKQLEGKITPRTKLIIAQHTYGYPCDIDEIMSIAGRKGIPVVEDCCLSLGSRFRGKNVGTFGRAAYFSFQWNKSYTSGIGGMAATSDPELAGRIAIAKKDEACIPSTKETLMLRAQLAVHRALVYPRTTALAQSLFRFLTRNSLVVGSFEMVELEPRMPEGFFKVMSEMQARTGSRKLHDIGRNIAHREKMSQLYDELLMEKRWTIQRYDASAKSPVVVRYPVRVTEKEKVLEEAARCHIELGSRFETPLHGISKTAEAYDYFSGMCPVAEKACREVVNLPTHLRVSDATARRTVDFITRFVQAK